MIDVPACAIIEVRRAGVFDIELHACVVDARPSVETLARGIYGDTRDSDNCYMLLEIPSKGIQILHDFLAEDMVQNVVVSTIFQGQAPIEHYAAYSGKSDELFCTAVYRPVPQRNNWHENGEGKPSLELCNWVWSWYATAKDYQQAFLAMVTPPKPRYRRG